ncbi:hypothetical protein FOWG_16814 [Fusarium oxysporum f. sp. lycopersici MN25]|nr:hypothetical protein FOWG_16814 [Fusarium oxysporum f. sp. lycopersici MN25]
MSVDKTGVFCTCFPKQVCTEGYGQLSSCNGCSLSIPDQESVYTAFKNVKQIHHVGTQGLSRKRCLIRTIIDQQRYQAGVGRLVRRYGIESLSSTIHSLLDAGAFTSHSAAKRLFPGLNNDTSITGRHDDEPIEESGAYDEVTEETSAKESVWEIETPAAETSYDELHCEPEVVAEEEPVPREPQPEAMVNELCKDDSEPLSNDVDIPVSDVPKEEAWTEKKGIT